MLNGDRKFPDSLLDARLLCFGRRLHGFLGSRGLKEAHFRHPDSPNACAAGGRRENEGWFGSASGFPQGFVG